MTSLLAGIVDYAGLFPPAGLDMPDAVRHYAEYRLGADAWALGRFVVPAARLAELEAAAAELLPPRPTAEPWRLSALGGADLRADLHAIGEFNCRHAADGAGAAVVDAVELKAATVSGIEAALAGMPEWLDAYVEIPIDRDPVELIAAIGRLGARAKVRTGGVTPDAFPAAGDLVRFLVRCVAAGVPFKATAGLHHPLRGEYRLTYAPESPTGTMYGYLNVFLAAALLRAGHGEHTARAMLEERDPAALTVDTSGITWRRHRLAAAQLSAAREAAHSFGSCSFREPIDDLTALNLQRVTP